MSDIRKDDEAMNAIRLLISKGYSGDEVACALVVAAYIGNCVHERLNECGGCYRCGIYPEKRNQ